MLAYIGVLAIIGGAIFFLTRSAMAPEPASLVTAPAAADNPKPKGEQLELTGDVVELETNFGTVTLELYPEEAPRTVNNFLKLAKAGFYDGTKFHRVIKDFMIQGGDPNSKDDNWADDGTGGPGYTFEDEFNEHRVVRGVIAMANSGPDTNGSQFFIVTAESTPWLDGKHTVFGRAVKGMEVVDKIENVVTTPGTDPVAANHPTQDIIIKKVIVTGDINVSF